MKMQADTILLIQLRIENRVENEGQQPALPGHIEEFVSGMLRGCSRPMLSHIVTRDLPEVPPSGVAGFLNGFLVLLQLALVY